MAQGTSKAAKVDVIAPFIHGRKTDWESETSVHRKRGEFYWRQWRVQASDEDKTYKSEISEIKTPLTRTVTNTAYDNIIQTVFARVPFFDIKGRTPFADIPARILVKYIDYLFGVQRFKSQYKLYIKELCILGTAVGLVTPRKTTVKHVKIEETTNDFGDVVGTQAVEVEKDIIRPEFKYIPLKDFFIEPSANDPQTAEGCIFRTFKKLHALKKMQRAGEIKGVGRLKANSVPTSEDGSGVVDENERPERLNRAGITAVRDSTDIEILTWYGFLDKELLKDAGYTGPIEDGGAEVICIVGNGNTVLKLEPNPFLTKRRPIVLDRFEEVPDEIYGIGLPEACEGSQRANDATVRQRIDNRAVSINNIWGIDNRKLEPGQDLNVGPNKVFITNGPPRDAIEQFQIADVTSSTYRETAEYERWAQESAGINKSLAGTPTNKEQSATESSIINNAANVKISTVVEDLEENSLKEILSLYYEIIIQFLDAPEVIRVTGDDGVERDLKITPRAVSGEFDFLPMGIHTIGLRNDVNKKFDFLTRTANPIDSQLIDRSFMLKQIYEALFGTKDIDAAIKSPAPPEQVTANAQNIPNVGSAPRLGAAAAAPQSQVPEVNSG